MKVSLAFNRNIPTPPGALSPIAEPMLDPAGPRLILGGENAAFALAKPIAPSRTSMFGSRGAAIVGPSLVVCDTGHHRLMIWNKVPDVDNAACD
ncbi:MAG: hypothetical protein L3J05_08695, partial [Robiginitomaculum sp.]|nr:hypothetical protein [Robiginitomaculum sp.]